MKPSRKDIQITYFAFDYFKDAEPQVIELVIAAKEATFKAYAPYSAYFVGAAARLSDEKIISAANIENASFPAGICAERATLSAVSSLGGQHLITDLAIAVKTERKSGDGIPAPCGICRQTLIEWEAKQNHQIGLWLLGHDEQLFYFKSVSHLMPLGFTGKQLGL